MIWGIKTVTNINIKVTKKQLLEYLSSLLIRSWLVNYALGNKKNTVHFRIKLSYICLKIKFQDINKAWKCLSICPPATFTENMSQHSLLIDALRSIAPISLRCHTNFISYVQSKFKFNLNNFAIQIFIF